MYSLGKSKKLMSCLGGAWEQLVHATRLCFRHGWPVPPAGDAGHTGSAPGLCQPVCAAVSTALSLSAACSAWAVSEEPVRGLRFDCV